MPRPLFSLSLPVLTQALAVLLTQPGLHGLVLWLLHNILALLFPPAKTPTLVKPNRAPPLHLHLGAGTRLEKTPTTARTGFILHLSLQISGLPPHRPAILLQCPVTLPLSKMPLCPFSSFLQLHCPSLAGIFLFMGKTGHQNAHSPPQTYQPPAAIHVCSVLSSVANYKSSLCLCNAKLSTWALDHILPHLLKDWLQLSPLS